MPDLFLAQAKNNAWANATLYRALLALSQEEFTAERPGFFASLAATMGHIYCVDLYYLDALTQGGGGRALYNQDPEVDRRRLAEAQARTDEALTRFCSALTPAMLNETRTTDRDDGPMEERVDRLLLHLFQHQVHHRGQAHVQLQHAGVAPPQLDEFYLEYDRAPSAEAYWT
ncbi:MAG: DinB family protein [Pseudomonadota bacterium]